MEVLRNGHSHWVTVTGRDAAKTTWLINDPADGQITTLARYGNNYIGNKVYAGPAYLYSDRSIVGLLLYSPAELLLTAPNGTQTGFDPVTNTTYNGIPGAAYQQAGQEDLDTDISVPNVKELLALQPMEGDYTIRVTGTGTGTYDLYLSTSDLNGNPSGTGSVLKVPTYPGATQEFSLNFSKQPNPSGATIIQLSGAYDGGGQRPKDVNKFLTYANPSDSPVTLPGGMRAFPLMLFYGPTTIPTTLSVKLNGSLITQWFHPTAGGSETVQLPLQAGRNVVELSINGSVASGRVATDSDRLVITAQ